MPDEKDIATEHPDLDLFHPWAVSSEEAAELAMRCEDAARIAEKIRLKAAKHPVPTEKGAVNVTASLGVAGCRSAKENVEEVMERADALLYLAKEGGRNQVRKSLVDEALRVRDEKKASDAIEAGIETNRRSNWISILHDMMSER